MPIPFSCPHCGQETLVADQYAGTSGPCSQCGRTITIPGKPGGVAPQSAAGAAGPTPGGGSSNVALVAIIVVVCGCLALGLLAALLIPSLGSARGAARRMQCTNNLKQITLALHNYHEVYRSLPPAYISDSEGRPMHSWRVLILPFMEQNGLYQQYNFDEPWDSPGNLAVAEQMPSEYRCPSAAAEAEANNLTSYVVIIGDPEHFPQTLFTPDHPIKFQDVRDGLSNTLAVVEVAVPVPWTQPDADLKFDAMRMEVGEGPNMIGSLHTDGANVAFADGSVHFLLESTDGRTLRALIGPADGQAVQVP